MAYVASLHRETFVTLHDILFQTHFGPVLYIAFGLHRIALD